MVLQGATIRSTGIRSHVMAEQPDTVGGLIKRSLRSKGLDQTKWARLVGVNQGTVSKWANDFQFPLPEYIPAVAQLCDVDEDTIRAMRYNLEPRSFAALEEAQTAAAERLGALEYRVDELGAKLDRIYDLVKRPPSGGDDAPNDDGHPEFISDTPR